MTGQEKVDLLIQMTA